MALNKTQQLPTSNCTNGSICVAHKHWGSVLNIKINIYGQSDDTLVFYNNPDRGHYRSGVVWTTADNDRAKSSRLHENLYCIVLHISGEKKNPVGNVSTTQEYYIKYQDIQPCWT